MPRWIFSQNHANVPALLFSTGEHVLLLLVIQRQIQTKLLNIYKKTWFEIRKIHKEEVPVSFHLVTKIQIMYNTSTCLFGVQYSNILLCTNYESTHLLPDSAKASLYPLMIVSINSTKYDKPLQFSPLL